MVSKMKTLLKDTYPALLLVTVVAGWGITGHSMPDATKPDYALRLLEWDPREELGPPAMESLACNDITRAPAANRAWCEDGDREPRASAGNTSNFDM